MYSNQLPTLDCKCQLFPENLALSELVLIIYKSMLDVVFG